MPLSETPNISALVFGSGGGHAGGGQQAALDDASWRPAFQHPSRNGSAAGGGSPDRALPQVAAGSAPSHRNPSRAQRGAPKQQQQQQQQRQVSRATDRTAQSRPGHSSVPTAGGTAPPPDPFYSQVRVGRLSTRAHIKTVGPLAVCLHCVCVWPFAMCRAVQAVREVYAAHAPEKLSQVETILARWSGREQALLMRLHKKCVRV